MYRRSYYWIILILTFLIVSCANTSTQKTPETKVLISTNYGVIIVKLYNATPKHRDNFIKLVEEHYYDDLLFHRVINEFMIQGGDPDSRGAKPNKRLGEGGPGYQIDAEFVDTIYHKKGALAAAREGDDENPEKKSDGSQFYLVQGKVFTNEQLDELEYKLYLNAIEMKREALMKKYKGRLIVLQNSGDYQGVTDLKIDIEEQAEEGIVRDSFKLNDDQREIYTTIGGVPHLDGNYTVFGEVVEGLAVIDSIAAVETNKRDRPIEDVIMQMKIIE